MQVYQILLPGMYLIEQRMFTDDRPPVRLSHLEPGLGEGPGDHVSTHRVGQRPRALGHVSLLWCRADHLCSLARSLHDCLQEITTCSPIPPVMS
jgi:hypothetical protein